jgi:CRISPR system Cascade subunit CasA
MADGTYFNLVDEPWIQVLDLTGARTEVSLRDAFTRADRLGELVGEVPTQSFANLRLLLAIAYRALDGPQDLAHWAQLAADWDEAVPLISQYLDRHRERFWMAHPSAPFFQVADLRTAKGEVSGLGKLIADVPNGLPFLTTRLGRSLRSIGWAEAARWLVHVHAYDPSGIRSGAVGDPRAKGPRGFPIGTAWAGQIGGVHAVGQALGETLLLNLVPETLLTFVTTWRRGSATRSRPPPTCRLACRQTRSGNRADQSTSTPGSRDASDWSGAPTESPASYSHKGTRPPRRTGSGWSRCPLGATASHRRSGTETSRTCL